MENSEFEFPIAIFAPSHDDIVFCGKVITRETKEVPLLRKSVSSGQIGVLFSWLRSISGKKIRTGKSGIPLQMELSDIKARQERNTLKSVKVPATAEDYDGELVRRLKRYYGDMST
ncbi:unnamed protein product [Lupinus luteus]|uniref:Uncharacterized protein n=1 Tax=Lupinus luteus TaxID=3873 RepID=A0AAV1VQI1_LUPLU